MNKFLTPEIDAFVTTELNKFVHCEWCGASSLTLIESLHPDSLCMCMSDWLDRTNKKRTSKLNGNDIVTWYKIHKHDNKTYHYFMTWTTNPKYNADIVRKNFKRFLERNGNLKIERVDWVEEHVDTNFHIHAYVICHKTLHKKHIAHYEKNGKINIQQCKGSVDEIIDYISKENTPQTFYGKMVTMGQG